MAGRSNNKKSKPEIREEKRNIYTHPAQKAGDILVKVPSPDKEYVEARESFVVDVMTAALLTDVVTFGTFVGLLKSGYLKRKGYDSSRCFLWSQVIFVGATSVSALMIYKRGTEVSRTPRGQYLDFHYTLSKAFVKKVLLEKKLEQLPKYPPLGFKNVPVTFIKQLQWAQQAQSGKLTGFSHLGDLNNANTDLLHKILKPGEILFDEPAMNEDDHTILRRYRENKLKQSGIAITFTWASIYMLGRRGKLKHLQPLYYIAGAPISYMIGKMSAIYTMYHDFGQIETNYGRFFRFLFKYPFAYRIWHGKDPDDPSRDFDFDDDPPEGMIWEPVPFLRQLEADGRAYRS